MTARVLVVGYGNDLRRDDGVGRRAAEAVAARGLPGVRAISVHQVTPELADLFGDVERVIFVDASANADAVSAQALDPARGPSRLGHVSDPRELLALAEAVSGRRPEAWLITIPAADLGYGEGLSEAAQRGLDQALRLISCAVAVPACAAPAHPRPARG